MEDRIQFRIEHETKNLAKKALDKKGISLSIALRTFLERLAKTERVMVTNETWLKEQIEETFSRIDSGEVTYYSEEEAEEMMNSFISTMEEEGKSIS